MKSVTVYMEEDKYEALRKASLVHAMKNGKRPSMNAYINAAITSYLSNEEIRKEDPPTNPSSKPTSEPLSEPSSKNPFSFDDL